MSEHGAEVVDFESAIKWAEAIVYEADNGDTLEERVEILARAHLALSAARTTLEKYARHKDDCDFSDGMYSVKHPCTCGLSAALGAP